MLHGGSNCTDHFIILAMPDGEATLFDTLSDRPYICFNSCFSLIGTLKWAYEGRTERNLKKEMIS